jgi:predicted metal-dependent phosphoesterase TrpH
MSLSRERLAAIRERLAAATPGPWEASHRHVHGTASDDEMAGLGWEIVGPPEPMNRGQFRRAADAALIANAPQDLADLLAERDALEAQVAALREALAEAHSSAARAPIEDLVHVRVDEGESWQTAWTRTEIEVREAASRRTRLLDDTATAAEAHDRQQRLEGARELARRCGAGAVEETSVGLIAGLTLGEMEREAKP